MIQPQDTLGEIATTRPESSPVFLRHRLDFCCGGRKSLAEACEAAGLDPQTIIGEIEAEGAAESLERWDTRPLPELVDFILSRYHETLRRDLPPLLEAARKVERVHAEKASCPRGLADFLAEVDSEIRQHLGKEEQVLFPALTAGIGGAKVQMPIRVMMQEHDDHGESLARLRELTGDHVPPPEACATWRALYQGLEKLEAELMEHIHLENNVLFPRALNE